MCTCIGLTTKNNYFGRNLDLDHRFGEKVVITPRKYKFHLTNGVIILTDYAMIGMASVIDGYPLYAEAANEKGLAMAALYFPGSAHFFKPKQLMLNLAQYELIPYFLGRFSSTLQVRAFLSELNITNIPFSDELPISDLHWMVSDGTECIVIEQDADGLHVYDNPLMLLTNNPPFAYQMNNLQSYINLTPHSPENRFSDKLCLKPYGCGMGAIGLPGDCSPASRFVRAAFNKLNSVCDDDEESSVTQFFHILDSAAMVKGTVITADNKYDMTYYSCCINLNDGVYYYKTYGNNRITAVKMGDTEKRSSGLTVYNLRKKQDIIYEN